MHIFPLLTLGFCTLGAFLGLKSFLPLLKSSGGLQDYFRSVEDQWSWTTQDGRSFEGVELAKIEGAEILLYHRLGVSSVEIAALSDESRQRLFCSSLWRMQSGNGLKELEKAEFSYVSADKDLRAA